jgi:putative holliday junction resolvase
MAVCDATGTLARPVGVIRLDTPGTGAIERVATEIARLSDEDDAVSRIVVGLPRRLDGSPNEMTAEVEAFAAHLHSHTGLPVHFQDERLSSREAESRLAIRVRDWRRRKLRLDAAAAAVILQDYLDSRSVRQPGALQDSEL